MDCTGSSAGALIKNVRVEEAWLSPHQGFDRFFRSLAALSWLDPWNCIHLPHHSQLIFCTVFVSNISSYPFFGINLNLCMYHFASA